MDAGKPVLGLEEHASFARFHLRSGEVAFRAGSVVLELGMDCWIAQ